MAISGVTDTVCSKLSGEFDKMYSAVNKVSTSINSMKSGLLSALNSMVFSTDDLINSSLSDLTQSINDSLPDIDESTAQELTDIINNCNFLSDDPILSNPMSLLNNCKDDKISGLSDLLKDSIPELQTGDLIGNITDFLSGGGTTDNLLKIDKLINCMSSFCGSGYTSKLSEIIDMTNDIYSTLNIVDDPANENYGNFDLDSVYSSVGISTENINKITNVSSAITNTKTTITSTLDSASGIAKGFI